ncbi:hypothetical protein BC567DRAFT_44725 [Phyllosticta citribraziliensis]
MMSSVHTSNTSKQAPESPSNPTPGDKQATRRVSSLSVTSPPCGFGHETPDDFQLFPEEEDPEICECAVSQSSTSLKKPRSSTEKERCCSEGSRPADDPVKAARCMSNRISQFVDAKGSNSEHGSSHRTNVGTTPPFCDCCDRSSSKPGK